MHCSLKAQQLLRGMVGGQADRLTSKFFSASRMAWGGVDVCALAYIENRRALVLLGTCAQPCSLSSGRLDSQCMTQVLLPHCTAHVLAAATAPQHEQQAEPCCWNARSQPHLQVAGESAGVEALPVDPECGRAATIEERAGHCIASGSCAPAEVRRGAVSVQAACCVLAQQRV